MTGEERLLAFVKARLDEDERDAGHIPTDLDWYARFQPAAHQGRGHEMAVRRLISRERLLREIAAKRKIIAEYQGVTKLAELTKQELGFLGWYREWVLKNLAATWSDHPDCQQEWKL